MFSNPKQNAAPKAKKDAQWKLSSPGLKRIKAPVKEIKAAIQRILLMLSLRNAENIELNSLVFTSMAISFLVALLAISALISWVRRSNYNIFVFYRIVLGIFLLAIAYDWI